MKYYVIDIYTKKFYGPFKNCKKAKKAARLVMNISQSNLLVEEGTNVFVVDGSEFACYSKYEEGDMDLIRDTYRENVYGDEINAIH